MNGAVAYISGPIMSEYRGLTVEEKKDRFRIAEETLKADFPWIDRIVNPLDLEGCALEAYCELVDDHVWECYMRRCLVALAECSHIAMIPGWVESKGATIEAAVARGLNYGFIYLDNAEIVSAESRIK